MIIDLLTPWVGHLWIDVFVLLHVQLDDSGTAVVDSICTIMMVEWVYTSGDTAS